MKKCIDKLIDDGPTPACAIDRETLDKLYMKGLIFCDVPVQNDTIVAGNVFQVCLLEFFISCYWKFSATVGGFRDEPCPWRLF